MERKQLTGLAILVLVGSAVAALGIGLAWFIWGQHVWAEGKVSNTWGNMPWEDMPMAYSQEQVWPDSGQGVLENLAADDAAKAAQEFLQSAGYPDLKVTEVIEFTQAFYVVAREQDTGTGAMELLVHKESGAVSPGPGPNMMWNLQYGMHGHSMMRQGGDSVATSVQDALRMAQNWLDTYRPGVVADGNAVAFRGYYTFRVMRDGEIEGLLSVRSNTGQVWYHTWHGEFMGRITLEGAQ